MTADDGNSSGSPSREDPSAMQSWLGAWGGLFAGVAALLAVVAAAASSYVAWATYRDQQQQNVQKFASRVEFWEEGISYVFENRNTRAARSVSIQVSYEVVERGAVERGADAKRPTSLAVIRFGFPDAAPCTRYIIDGYSIFEHSKFMKRYGIASNSVTEQIATFSEPDASDRRHVISPYRLEKTNAERSLPVMRDAFNIEDLKNGLKKQKAESCE